ncbi:unnamed protein product [Schistosoma mattheei]|uniref:Uncharacterized protein n=1 Tax=Schistosoma mattheei TaxID=31246 RepID=A0A183PG50_9TREM|nr:unnamed protein product [Schistosoma mattheei]
MNFVLKIVTLILIDSCFEFHMFFDSGNVALASPIITFMSASDCFFLISSSTGIWFVLPHSRLLLIMSGQRIGSILRRQLLLNTCIIWMMAFVVLQVSVQYSRTVFTFVLKRLTLVLVDRQLF